MKNKKIIVEKGWLSGYDSRSTHIIYNKRTSRAIESNFISILDEEFDADYGRPECPRIIAEDKYNIYFPVQYDRATWLEYINKDISFYLETNALTPYPGGG